MVSLKSLRNLIALLGHDVELGTARSVMGLVLPERDPLNERCLTLEEMSALTVAANEPYKTYYWILAETEVRAVRSVL